MEGNSVHRRKPFIVSDPDSNGTGAEDDVVLDEEEQDTLIQSLQASDDRLEFLTRGALALGFTLCLLRYLVSPPIPPIPTLPSFSSLLGFISTSLGASCSFNKVLTSPVTGPYLETHLSSNLNETLRSLREGFSSIIAMRSSIILNFNVGLMAFLCVSQLMNYTALADRMSLVPVLVLHLGLNFGLGGLGDEIEGLKRLKYEYKGA